MFGSTGPTFLVFRVLVFLDSQPKKSPLYVADAGCSSLWHQNLFIASKRKKNHETGQNYLSKFFSRRVKHRKTGWCHSYSGLIFWILIPVRIMDTNLTGREEADASDHGEDDLMSNGGEESQTHTREDTDNRRDSTGPSRPAQMHCCKDA